MDIKEYIRENESRFLDELFSLIRIPSVSAEPKHKEDMLACAERWRQLLLEAGADEAMVMPSQGNPLVYAEKRISPRRADRTHLRTLRRDARRTAGTLEEPTF